MARKYEVSGAEVCPITPPIPRRCHRGLTRQHRGEGDFMVRDHGIGINPKHKVVKAQTRQRNFKSPKPQVISGVEGYHGQIIPMPLAIGPFGGQGSL